MRRVLLLIAILCLAFAPVPFPKPDRRTDLQKLQGEWVQASYTFDGKKETIKPGEHTVLIKGNKFTFLRD